jgi:hypothetical protein
MQIITRGLISLMMDLTTLMQDLKRVVAVKRGAVAKMLVALAKRDRFFCPRADACLPGQAPRFALWQAPKGYRAFFALRWAAEADAHWLNESMVSGISQ